MPRWRLRRAQSSSASMLTAGCPGYVAASVRALAEEEGAVGVEGWVEVEPTGAWRRAIGAALASRFGNRERAVVAATLSRLGTPPGGDVHARLLADREPARGRPLGRAVSTELGLRAQLPPSFQGWSDHLRPGGV